MNKKNITPVVITLGDPGGIGPRVILESCRDLIQKRKNFFFLIADFAQIKPMADRYNCPIEKIRPNNKINPMMNKLHIYDFPLDNTIIPGTLNSAHAKSILGMIDKALELIKADKACALVTGPVNKQLISEKLGINFNGHTEYLANALEGKSSPVMMMQAGKFRVVPLTQHIPICDVSPQITKIKIKEVVKIISKDLKRIWKIKNPRIFISGLNPHAGDNGAIGNEEINIIKPAIQELLFEGFNVTGPFPADSLFSRKLRASFDVAICMYHDQALIPIKSLFFDSTINITLGLPIIRTSPGHGTAVEMVHAENINTTSFKNSLLEAYKIANLNSTFSGKHFNNDK